MDRLAAIASAAVGRWAVLFSRQQCYRPSDRHDCRPSIDYGRLYITYRPTHKRLFVWAAWRGLCRPMYIRCCCGNRCTVCTRVRLCTHYIQTTF